MWATIQQYLWVPGLAYLVWHAPRFERRAYGLVGAGRLSPAEASRITRFAWLSVFAIVVAVTVAQLTYPGPRGPCPMYADPHRPVTLVMWAVIMGVALTVASFTLTPAGRAFLARAWPAFTLTKPLSRVWQPREAVRSALLNTLVFVLYLCVILGIMIGDPGSIAGC